MFRDKEEALEELNSQLLEDEGTETEDLAKETESDEDLPQEIYRTYTGDVRVYNSDTADTDLEKYSDDVYREQKNRLGCALWFVLLTAAVLLVIAYWIARQEGLV